MVHLTRIYTKTGDDGTTAIGNNERRRKDDLRIEAMGAVDEVNCTVGLARIALKDHAEAESLDPRLDTMLARIQNDLFDLGADLATPDRGEPLAYEPLRIVAAQVARLESEIDALNEALQPLRSFVLPGGSAASAFLHQARAVSRRAERVMVALAGEAEDPNTGEWPVSEAARHYINRLSDFLFVAARTANDKGAADVLWVPGAYR